MIASGQRPSGWTNRGAKASGPSCASSTGCCKSNCCLTSDGKKRTSIYPQVANLLGGRDPLAALSRTHREIVHLVNVYRRLIADLPPQGADQALWSDLRRVLFSLEAILRLHIDQEDEVYDIVGQPG